MRDWLTEKAAAMPDQELLVAGDESLTYRQVAERVAARVAELGDRGATQVVVKPRLDFDSVVELLAVPLTGATAIVISPDRADGDDLIRLAGSDHRQAHTVMFTSGSSGRPKGVRLSSANWEAAAHAFMEHLGLQPAERWLCPLPLHHVGGLSIIYRSLLAGGTVVLESDLDRAAGWLDRVAWVSLVPTQLHRILSKRTDTFTSPLSVLLGGGPAASILVRRGLEAGLRVLPTYGMTESTSQAATARVPGGPLELLPGVDIEIDESEHIVIRGATVMLGYVGEPEIEGVFVTSDRGRVHPDGSLEVLGRADRVIITGGEKVDPSMVESAIASLPGVTEVVVLPLADPEWGERVVAVFVGDADPTELASVLRSTLPAYAIPKQWLRVDALPHTDLGKVDVAALSGLFPTASGA